VDDIFLKQHQFGHIFDHFSVGVIHLSPTRRILSMNRAAELITGQEESAVVGKYCYQTFQDFLCDKECRFQEIVAAGGKAEGHTFELTDQGQQKHSITRIISPIYSPDHELLGCIEVFQDLSTVKDLIERVRHDERRLKIILDNLDIGVLTVDRGGHITFFNTMIERITGFKREEVLGKTYTGVFGETAANDFFLLDETISDGEPRSGRDGQIVTQKGEILPIRANYMALKNEEERIVGGLATISDLSLIYQLNSAIKDHYTFYDMVGKDPAMQKIFEVVPVIAASDATVLIEGPTGTGKDILAKVIHTASNRSTKPLVKVNCAALPDNLLESEMFGYVKGAFTGADKDKPGRFQEADGGTIFLDEIGDLPLSLQAKLLRVLEDKDFYPLGSRRPTKVDIRIISATNLGLEQLVQEKRFREDLFYRLNVMRLELPSLKERKSDLPLLISHILKRLCTTRGTLVDKISEDAMEVLLNHDYPGSIRELENIIEHALILCQGNTLERNHLPLMLQKNALNQPARAGANAEGLLHQIESNEKMAIESILKQHNWNRKKTARALNINRTTLWRKMKRHGITM